MQIKLIGDLDSELTALGCKEGDILNAEKCPVSTVGAVYFEIYKFGSKYDCVVWPENYQVITNSNTPTT
ncbi:MAG: hypothetical protein WCI92_07555 [Bacteroidota bacterium]